MIRKILFSKFNMAANMAAKSINLRNFDAIQSNLTRFYGDVNRFFHKYFEINLNNPELTLTGSSEAQ